MSTEYDHCTRCDDGSPTETAGEPSCLHFHNGNYTGNFLRKPAGLGKRKTEQAGRVTLRQGPPPNSKMARNDFYLNF